MRNETATTGFSGAYKLCWQRGICSALFLVRSIPA